MTLTLRIENVESLPDGGPTFVRADGNGLTVGRSSAMDWTLPDPQRHISGHHFDIVFRNGAYFLKDVSTNGVFLDGQKHRIEGEYALRQSDRFQVGHYFITVQLGGGAPAASAHSAPASAPMPDDGDPWALDAAPVKPVDVRPRPDPRAFEDFASDFIVNPVAPTPAPPPVQHPQSGAPVPPAAPSPFGGSDSPFGDGSGPANAPAPLQPLQLSNPLPPAAPLQSGDQNHAILAAFCEGAGLPPPTAGSGADATALARELGRTMQAAAAELMALLQDRAAAKKFTRGGDRTMMGATNNNPLKFLPDPAQALEVMFVQPRDGFMTGGEGMTAALRDVKTHQMAVFAAIQPALIKLLEDLSPEAIEEDAGKGMLKGGRKSWDEYVKRWDDKVANAENGMLDVFLRHFAESYAAAVAAARE